MVTARHTPRLLTPPIGFVTQEIVDWLEVANHVNYCVGCTLLYKDSCRLDVRPNSHGIILYIL